MTGYLRSNPEPFTLTARYLLFHHPCPFVTELALLDGKSSIRWTRPALPGAGEWSHIYGNPANTACSNDTLSYSKLGMQWYGRLGPRNMVDRHGKQPPPLYKNGRLFVTGANYFAALDGYNGTLLWKKNVPNSIRLGAYVDGSNMVATDDSLLVTTDDTCREFDAQKGSLRHQYQISKLLNINGKRNWGYIANVGDLLFGSTSTDQALNRDPSLANIKGVWGASLPIVCSDAVFVIDQKTAKAKWTYQSKNGVIINPCIAIANGKMVFIESESQSFDKLIKGRATLAALVERAKLVALDIQSGKVIWQESLDVAQIRDVLHLSIAKNTIIMMGSNYRATTKDERRGLKKPEQEKRLRYHIFGRSLKEGKALWQKEEVPVFDHILNGGHGENIQHPALVGDVLYGPRFALHIEDGAAYLGWKWKKSGYCETISTSLNCAFSRSGNPMIFDLKSGSYSTVTESSRPGCWINIIPAGGMVLIPENSSGCSCEYSLQTSMTLIPE